MKEIKELKKMSLDDLKSESKKHWDYVRLIDSFVNYKELWQKMDTEK